MPIIIAIATEIIILCNRKNINRFKLVIQELTVPKEIKIFKAILSSATQKKKAKNGVCFRFQSLPCSRTKY